MEKWEKVGAYKECIGLAADIIKTETINGRTVRTIEEYEIWAYGTEYRKGTEIKRIEEQRERVFVGRYTQEYGLIMPA